MKIAEILNKDGKLDKWECYFDDGTSQTYSIGEIFIEWCSKSAVSSEKSFQSIKAFKEGKKTSSDWLLSSFPKRWIDEFKEPYYIESETMREIHEAIKNNDMPEVYNIVLEAVESIYISEIISLNKDLEDIKPTITVNPYYNASTIVDRSGVWKEDIRYGKYYTITTPADPSQWLDAFVLIDFQEMMQNKNLKLSVCTHCFRTFIVTSKNQKYCEFCRANKISDKKKQNTEKQKLYRNIYGKIYARKKGNIPNNDYGIDSTTESFSDAWKEFLKTNPTHEEQIEWLKDVDYQISRDNLRYY